MKAPVSSRLGVAAGVLLAAMLSVCVGAEVPFEVVAPQEVRLFEATDGYSYGPQKRYSSPSLLSWQALVRMDRAGTITEVHAFLPSDGPVALIEGSDGIFYGVTAAGGTHGFGTVFRYMPASGLTTIHEFASCATGCGPRALVEAADGRLYGVAGGGLHGKGIAFRVSNTGVGFNVLHDFAGGASDGDEPSTGFLQATHGNFYGNTTWGGRPSSRCTARGQPAARSLPCRAVCP